MGAITATRYHDFSAGHRVCGHESKCAMLHGHNYRVHFTVTAESLDQVGRVMDFSVIKSRLCQWLEDNYDHKFLAYKYDEVMQQLHAATASLDSDFADTKDVFWRSIVWTDFNPTAENMAKYLLDVVGPKQLLGTGVKLVKVVVEETRKCSAEIYGEIN